MHRPPARFLMFAAVMAVTLSGGLCAPLSKDEPAPVIPHYDATDQPFRMAPMPQSTRSIVVSLTTNLHLAFDTALLRTHTVWSGRGLALLGPQFGLPKAPFISTNDTTVLWGMPPVFPWAVGKLPEKDAETLLPGTRFIAVKSSPTRFEYELATGGERPALIQEMPDSFSGAINGLHRHLTVQSNRSELWFLAHAEMCRGESLSPQAAVLERADTALLVSVRGRLDLKLQLQERNASYSVETVTEQGAVKGNPRQTISGKEVRAWVQIPPTQPGDIQGIQITTEVFRSKRDAVEWFQLSAARAKVSVCFARTNSGGPPVFSSAGLRPSAASTSSYRAEAFPLPKEIELSVCGMDFLPNGDLVVCTWPGEVFIVEKATGPVKGARYRRFARGLCEPLGVAVRDGKIYVGTKPGLYRLTDTDGNGEADLFECVSQGWGYYGHYNSF
ncbi:MAG: hypothetical protein WCS99_21605, partial [Limisphaerales bacterium]